MRAMSLAVTAGACLFGLTIASDVRADAVKVSPQLTVFTQEQTRPENGGPTLLRGDATKRGTVDARFGGRTYEPTRFQVGAGDKLWLTDPISGEVIVCDERRTNRVGSRFIGCLKDELPDAVYK
ncbi:MAG: hypothetical protein AAGA21_13600 [Pseudomonadota bacterium]